MVPRRCHHAPHEVADGLLDNEAVACDVECGRRVAAAVFPECLGRRGGRALGGAALADPPAEHGADQDLCMLAIVHDADSSGHHVT
eukprot:2590821-Pyramimonas_sp.AAC.1